MIIDVLFVPLVNVAVCHKFVVKCSIMIRIAQNTPYTSQELLHGRRVCAIVTSFRSFMKPSVMLELIGGCSDLLYDFVVGRLTMIRIKNRIINSKSRIMTNKYKVTRLPGLR